MANNIKEFDLGNVADIEVLPDFFLLGIEDWLTKKQRKFEISQWVDDRFELYDFLVNNKRMFVGWNFKEYDNVILTYFVKNFDRFEEADWFYITEELRWFSDKLFAYRKDQDDQKLRSVVKDYLWGWNKQIEIVDPLLFWSRGLRIQKQLSLKAIGIQLKWDETQELPYDGSKRLTLEERDEMIHYNLRNDLGRTRAAAEALSKEIFFRRDILEQRYLPCWSFDGPKIAQQLIERSLIERSGDPEICYRKTDQGKVPNQTYRDKVEIKDILFEYDFIPKYVSPQVKTEKVQKKGKSIKRNIYIYENPYSFYQDLLTKTVRDTSSISAKVLFKNPDGSTLTAVYGSGGIHGTTETCIFDEKKGYQIIDFDFASYYPNLMVRGEFVPQHLKDLFLDFFKALIADRIAAKRIGDKITAEILKLMLNSTYGMLNNIYSFMYDWQQTLAVCLNGELIISQFIEKCIQKGYSVIYANTDGFSIKVEGGEKEAQEAIDFVNSINTWDIELETFRFSKWWMVDVNNYMAMYKGENEGEIKAKGLFLQSPKLGDSTNELVIRKALYENFKDGKDMREFIENHSDIWDFCRSDRVNKTYEVYHGLNKVQNLNVYYISKDGLYLTKKNKEGKSRKKEVEYKGGTLFDMRQVEKIEKEERSAVLKDYRVTLFNKFEQKPFTKYKVNKEYYITKAMKLYKQLHNPQFDFDYKNFDLIR